VPDLIGESLGKLLTALGYDGTYFRNFWIDKHPKGHQALRTSFPLDRDPSDASIICDGTWGNHATTTRATYTVPDDRQALIMSIFGATSLIVPAGLAIIMVDKAGIRLFNMITDNTLNYREVNQSILAHVWASSGELVDIRTFNNTGANVVFYATLCIMEFDA